MTLAPLDIHNKVFTKAFRGYDEDEVNEFMAVISKEYEQIFKENLDLKEKLLKKDSNIVQYQDLEETLKKTLVIAQKTADDMRENASKESELIVSGARQQADRIKADAHEQAKNLIKEYEDVQKRTLEFKTMFRAMLRSQLDVMESSDWESQAAVARQEG